MVNGSTDRWINRQIHKRLHRLIESHNRLINIWIIKWINRQLTDINKEKRRLNTGEPTHVNRQAQKFTDRCTEIRRKRQRGLKGDSGM